jgi:hypothetical protein
MIAFVFKSRDEKSFLAGVMRQRFSKNDEIADRVFDDLIDSILDAVIIIDGNYMWLIQENAGGNSYTIDEVTKKISEPLHKGIAPYLSSRARMQGDARFAYQKLSQREFQSDNTNVTSYLRETRSARVFTMVELSYFVTTFLHGLVVFKTSNLTTDEFYRSLNVFGSAIQQYEAPGYNLIGDYITGIVSMKSDSTVIPIVVEQFLLEHFQKS